MKRLLIVGLLAIGLAQSATAVTMTFDDVPGGSIPNAYGFMPSGYYGFDFTETLQWIDVGGTNWPFGAVSGDFALLNNYGGVGTITKTDGADFSFDGVWAKAWDTPPDSGGPPVVFGTLSGYKDGGVIWSIDTALNGSYQFFSAQDGQIDELRLGFGNHFLVDNLSLNGATPPVPEPGTYALMLAGLGLLGFIARRRSA